MTLSEYITREFGMVPDEVQLETIKELVSKELMSKVTRESRDKFLSELKTNSQTKDYYPITTKIFK